MPKQNEMTDADFDAFLKKYNSLKSEWRRLSIEMHTAKPSKERFEKLNAIARALGYSAEKQNLEWARIRKAIAAERSERYTLHYGPQKNVEIR